MGTPAKGTTQLFRMASPSPPLRPPPLEQESERDVFARSDKWLPSLPTIDFSSWKDRISEALGFLTWMEKLTSWVGLGSEVFPNELMHAVKIQEESRLKQDRLTVGQQKRSTRLMHILRQTFANHEKSSLILQTYVESESTYQQSGFVALRLLAKEFCLKSRAECLFFRSQLVNQTVKAPSIPEIIRKIEHELNKYTKLLNSLDPDVHAGGLQIQEADSVMVLLRSLPDRCRSHCLLHGDSESFEDLKRVALKFEVQQRVWSEAPGTKLQPFRDPNEGKGNEGKPKGKGKEQKGKRESSKGAGKRASSQNKKDVECYVCGGKGHYARDCWYKEGDSGKKPNSPNAKAKAKAKGDPKKKPEKGKPKGKGKGKGKTVAEVSQEGESSDYQLTGGEWNEPESEARVESVLQPLEELLDEVRKEWIPRSTDEIDWSWEVETRVRIAELEHRISTDLSQMLPSKSVRSLMKPPMNQVKSMEKDDASKWWLIDSGASVTVIAKRYLDEFQILDRKALGPNERYSAANDTPVNVFERVRIRALLPMYEGKQYLGLTSVCVTGVVADVAHNILSTEQMVNTGWEVKFTRREISLRHEKKGVMGYGVSWAGCPWIYLQGDAGKRKKVTFGRTEVRPMDVDDGQRPMEVDQMQSVQSMTKKRQEEMELHRMRGHIPFSSECPHCRMTRGTTQHRRTKDAQDRPVALQADFCFINLVTGTFAKDQPTAPNMKVLVMTEMSTRMIGCLLVGTNADNTSSWIRYWMNAFGLDIAGSAVLLRTDSETAVSALIKRANLGIRIVTQRAPPQGHEAVGGVERAVRTLKELFSTVRLDLRAQGFDLKRSPRAFEFGLIYCAAMHNHHAAAFDGKKSPQELVLQRSLHECGSSLIGATVLAELPDSMKTTALSRFVEAAYVYPEVGGLTHVVSAMVDGCPKHFRAKSIKHIVPLNIGLEHCQHLLKEHDPSDTLAPPILKEKEDGVPDRIEGEADKAFEGRVSDGPTTDMSKVGPPAAWVKEHGGTANCPACGPKRGKANHNAECRKRYDDWLKAQRQRLESKEPTEETPQMDQRSSKDAGVMESGSEPSLLKRPKITYESRPDPKLEERQSVPTPATEVVDVDMEDFEDPSLPYQGIPDEAMEPGYFEGETPAEDEAIPMEEEKPQMDVDSVPNESSRVPRRLESLTSDVNSVPDESNRVPRLINRICLDPRLDVPQGPIKMVSSDESPKLVHVTNSILLNKNSTFPESMKVCGSQVWLARPTSVLSEIDGCPLDVDKTVEGRRTELQSMTAHKAGRVVGADEAQKFARQHGIKIIPTRWVIGPKVVNGKEAVRARCVVQDIAKGSTASSLGLSATTPSLEALRTLLAIASVDAMDVATLDVSTAFLHSPLPKGSKAIIQLPKDVSACKDYYVPVFMILDQAMNGLRVAAKAWNLKLATVVKKVGLKQCPTEPSVFEGTVRGKRFLMLCYVDDLILCGTRDAIRLVTDTLNGELKIKETGRITSTGGKITFLGREIERQGSHLRMRVPPAYLDALFETEFCKDLKVVTAPPDIVKTVEKGRASGSDPELSDTAAARYRAVLGRIAWWGQSRPDLSRWMSILSQGQSKPTACFEQALRQVIRFLKGQYHAWQYFGPDGNVPDSGPAQLEVYADASWAPQASLGRRSVSGIAIFYRGCLIKGISRVQGCVSLSSCEAELRAILTAVQESEGLATLIGQLAESDVTIRLHTDSSSARAVLLNRGLSRRVRHLDIAVCYLQERIQEAQTLKVIWCPTAGMIADVLTKCLSQVTFCQHQQAMGIYPGEDVQQVWRICGIRPRVGVQAYQCAEATGCSVEQVGSLKSVKKCGEVFENFHLRSPETLREDSSPEVQEMDLWSTRKSFGSSTTEASPSLEPVPLVKDRKMAAEDSRKGEQGAEMKSPFWCKVCKWLFRSEHAAGLSWDESGKPKCEKCKQTVTVSGTDASHAFHLREAEKERRAAGKRGDKGESRGSGQAAPKPKAMPKVIERMVDVFPELADPEPPKWFGDVSWSICRRGTPVDELELKDVIGTLSDKDMLRYQSSYEKLVKPIQEVCELQEKPTKIFGILDVRGQIGGKAIIWEMAVNEGGLYMEVPPGTCGLAMLSFVRYLKRKGIIPVLLLGEHQDLGVLRMVDLLCMLPILGAERIIEDEAESSYYPPWVLRWKRSAKEGSLVFKELVERVRVISMLSCDTLRIHEPELRERPVPKWSFVAYSHYRSVMESVAGFLEDLEKKKEEITDTQRAASWKKVVASKFAGKMFLFCMAKTCTAHKTSETRSGVVWICKCKWHLPTDYVVRFNLTLPADMWQQAFGIMGENVGKLEKEEKDLKRILKAAAEQQDREFEEAERKRKRIADLSAAEEEAAKRAKLEGEAVRSPVSVVPSELDAAAIAQIAERVKASFSVADLELMLEEKKRKVGDQPTERPAETPAEPSRSSQDVVMETRTAELAEMKEAAKERRAKLMESTGAGEKKGEEDEE